MLRRRMRRWHEQGRQDALFGRPRNPGIMEMDNDFWRMAYDSGYWDARMELQRRLPQPSPAKSSPPKPPTASTGRAMAIEGLRTQGRGITDERMIP